MIHVVRSELVRLRRRSLVAGWGGLMVVLAVLINAVVFQVVEQRPAPGAPAVANGPGVSFPTAAELLAPSGIVSGLSAAASFFGVVTLSFWALATAVDHSSGLVRLTVAAEPRRWRLVAGKWLALALATALATVLAVVTTLVVAPVAAGAAGWEPTAWGDDLAGTVLRQSVDLYLSLLVWGSIGLALALLTRSAGIAIGVGLGYVLLLEGVIGALSSEVGRWLPGTTISALAAGGTDDVAYGSALALGLGYCVVAVLASVLVFARRDITD